MLEASGIQASPCCPTAHLSAPSVLHFPFVKESNSTLFLSRSSYTHEKNESLSETRMVHIQEEKQAGFRDTLKSLLELFPSLRSCSRQTLQIAEANHPSWLMYTAAHADLKILNNQS